VTSESDSRVFGELADRSKTPGYRQYGK